MLLNVLRGINMVEMIYSLKMNVNVLYELLNPLEVTCDIFNVIQDYVRQLNELSLVNISLVTGVSDYKNISFDSSMLSKKFLVEYEFDIYIFAEESTGNVFQKSQEMFECAISPVNKLLGNIFGDDNLKITYSLKKCFIDSTQLN